MSSYSYEIRLSNELLVADSGAMVFKTKDKAYADAIDFIQTILMEEYEALESDFIIDLYEENESF